MKWGACSMQFHFVVNLSYFERLYLRRKLEFFLPKEGDNFLVPFNSCFRTVRYIHPSFQSNYNECQVALEAKNPQNVFLWNVSHFPKDYNFRNHY